MAAVQQRLQAHGKTRSAHISANTSRPLQHVSVPQLPPSSGHNGGGYCSTAPPLVLFINNLKLLDLQLLPDWPDISVDTFATGTTASSAQGQKKRIQCVEWALFRLFAIWDPEETANKLKPFFPPLDQVQSLNLRAALLRGLEQAKKKGVLGRDTVLRKTMLDECKGERLEEVLASFSAAVLKSVVIGKIAAQERHPALALTLAVEPKGYKDDKMDLITLIIAHKVSLQGMRSRKEDMAAKYRDFGDLLGIKERGVIRRKEEARQREKDSMVAAVSDEARREMWRMVRNNWSGHERWMETLLRGDAGASKDGLFSMSFDRVWRRVEQNRLGEVEAKGAGLLEQLEGRVQLHRDRLEKWQNYRHDIFRGQTSDAGASPSKSRASSRGTRGIDLGFGAHKNLVPGKVVPGKTGVGRLSPNAEYRDMLEGLENELAEVDDPPSNPLMNLPSRHTVTRRYSGTERASTGTISELSDLDDELRDIAPPPKPPAKTSSMMEVPTTRRLPVRPRLPRPDEPSTHEPPRRSFSSRSQPKLASPPPMDISRDQSPHPSTPSSGSRGSMDRSGSRPYFPGDDVPISPTRAAAEQILELIDKASPSPSKRSKPRHTLSLADRTRLSMGPRASMDFLEHDEPEPEPEPTKKTPPSADRGNSRTLVDDDDDDCHDLVSRTRRSMAGFEKAKQKAQIERRRSQRMSRLPPRREGSHCPVVEEDESERTMLAEELLGEEDMEAVFRSRPKIKASPMPSPTKELEFDDY